jgi:ABC-type antimicrobial peptide transport system permease subunit
MYAMKIFLKDLRFYQVSLIIVSILLFSVALPNPPLASTSAFSPTDPKTIIASIDHERISEHLRFFSSLGSRVTGYPGCSKAADYIFETLSALRIVNLTRHFYKTTIPIDYGANLTIIQPLEEGGRALTVYALSPNMVQTCPTPPTGIEGHLIYAGDGEFSSFNGKIVNGSIVLMDFNTDYNWQNAIVLGAKAVLFIEPNYTYRHEAEKKFVNIPLNFPRLWVPKDEALYLLKLLEREEAKGREVRVNIKSYMQYEIVKAENIYGFIQGTDPILKDEVIAIAAHYDSWSIVPSLAPGANDAVGIATLLELARFFSENPPKRTIMFLALSGHYQSLDGSRQFIEDKYWGRKTMGTPTEWWVLKTKFFIGLDINTLSNSIEAPFAAGWRYYWGIDYGIPRQSMRDVESQSYDFWELLPTEANFKKYRTEIEKAWKELYGAPPAEINVYGNIADDDATGTRSSGPYQFVPIVPTVEAFWYPGPTSWSYVTLKHFALNLETPLDTYERLNWENLWPQLEWIFYSLQRLVNEDKLGDSYKPDLEGGVIIRFGRGSGWHWAGFSRIHGIAVRYNVTTAGYDPIPGALVYIYLKGVDGLTWPTDYGYRAMQVVKADENGRFEAFGWGSAMYVGTNLPNALNLDVYVINSTGHILYAPNLGEYGGRDYPIREKPIEQAEVGFEDNPYRCVAFPCASIYLPLALNPNSLSGGGGIQILDIAHTPARFFGFATYDGYNLMAFLEPGRAFEIVLRQDIGEPMIILMNLKRPEAQGPGFTLSQGDTIYLTPEDYARQFYYLNYARGGRTAEYGIVSPAAMDRLRTAEKFLEEAQEAYKNLRYDKWLASSMFAWAVVREAWEPSRTVFDEVVRSVIFFFTLLLPFVLVFEKLTTNWESSKWRILTIVVVFIAFSAVFALIHPGFSLASNIFGVLVGFIGGILCVPIVVLLFGEIRATIKRFQAILRGYKVSEVEVVGASTSAISIGVTHMRKRKLRTVMTMFSVSIVVYAIVMTSSIAPMARYLTIDTGTKPNYEGMLVVLTTPEAAGTGFGTPSPLHPELLRIIECDVGSEAIISKRGYFSPSDFPYRGSRYMTIVGPNGSYDAFTVLGLSPEEYELSLPDNVLLEGRWFESGDLFNCIISAERAKELGIRLGDPELGYVKFGGSEAVKLYVVGIVKDEVFNAVDDLWGFYQPVDPRFPLIPGVKPTKLPIRDYIIVPFRFVEEFPWSRPEGSFMINPIRMKLYSIVVKFQNTDAMMQYVDRLSNPLSRLYFFVGLPSENKTLMIQRSNLYQVSLTPTAFLPTIISSIMLFNVIMGSIYERRREVSVYSSVGLSPMHVALMFLSETFVYAAVASVLGYFGAMITNYLIRSMGVSIGIMTNYASWAVLAAVGASFLSTTLPGLFTLQTAGRMVTPSLERRWSLKTKPRGDEWTIPLPFRPTAEDAPGIIAFVYDFFKLHEAEHAGLPFVAKETSSSKSEDVDKVLMSVGTKVSLEPYEAGVSQEVWVDVVIPRGRSVADVSVRLHRLTGTLEDWERFNYRFVDGIRKHLLLWRGLPPEKREEFVKRGETYP